MALTQSGAVVESGEGEKKKVACDRLCGIELI
jgi:hypothetical protein